MAEEHDTTTTEVVAGVLSSIQVSLAQLNGKMDTMQAQLQGRLNTHERELSSVRERMTTLATKREVEVVREDVSEVRDWQRWAIRVVLGLVIAAAFAASVVPL